MTDLMEKALATVRRWPAEQQDEAAQILLALDRLGAGAYRASDDELRAVDDAIAQIERARAEDPPLGDAEIRALRIDGRP